MRVVMVGAFGLRPKGTLSVRALPLARALAARGHRVTLLAPPWDNPSDSGRRWREGEVEIENVQVHPAAAIWPRLAQRSLQLQPDLVHCFKPKAYAGLTALTLEWLKRLRLSRTRLVVDADDWEGAGGWNEALPYSGWQKWAFAWQEQHSMRANDALTVASRALETIAWSLGISRGKVHYLPNGVDSTLLDVQRPPAQSRGSQVLLYTRFVEFEIGTILRVFRLVCASLPEARLQVLGQGFRGEERALAQQAEAAGLGDRIIIHGWAPERRERLFDQCAVAFYPFDDTLLNRTKCPVKLAELLAAGLPVVASRVGQIGEYVEHKVSGWLVSPGDEPGCAAALVELLRDGERRELLGRGARRRMENFTWERLAAVAEQAYGV